MPKFRVYIHEDLTHKATVEADNAEEAEAKANAVYDEHGDLKTLDNYSLDVREVTSDANLL